MIRPIHLRKLTTAKLRAKPILLGITIGLSSFLFAILLAGIILFSGFMKSSEAYIRNSNNGQYLVRVQPYIPSEYLAVSNTNISAPLIKKLRSLETTYIQEQTELSKKQGSTYVFSPEDSVLQADPFADASTPKELRYVINANSPVYAIYLQILASDYAKIATNTQSNLKKLVHDSYNTDTLYSVEYSSTNPSNTVWLQQNKESFDRYSYQWRPDGTGFTPYDLATASARMSSYSISDMALVVPYLLPENEKRKDNQSAIPVVISQQEAVALFGDKLAISAKPDTIASRGAWAHILAEKVNGQTYQACYRNSAEQQLIETYRRTIQEKANNTTNSDYIPPRLEYSLPETPCGDITVSKDTRSPSEKKLDENKIADEKKRGTYIAPQHTLLTFIVVGLVPFEPQDTNQGISLSSISSLFGVTRFDGAIIPRQLITSHTEGFEIITNKLSRSGVTEIFDSAGLKPATVAFNSIDDARRFLKNETCSLADQQCNKQYYAEQYGANYLLLDDLKQFINSFFLMVAPWILLVAFVIMIFAMSRSIIESRVETTIFRALGADTVDIFLIYLCYGGTVSILIAAISVLGGVTLAIIGNVILTPSITNYITSGQVNHNVSFTLLDFTSVLLPYTLLLIVGIGILATLIALSITTNSKIANTLRD